MAGRVAWKDVLEWTGFLFLGLSVDREGEEGRRRDLAPSSVQGCLGCDKPSEALQACEGK